MTDVDLNRDERRLRADLHRSMVPPPTSERLRLEVDRLAEAAIDAERARGARPAWWPRRRPAIGGLRLGAALMAIVVLAAGSLLLVSRFTHRDDVATSPSAPVPSLPAITGPALPSAPPNGSQISEGAWISPSSAWVIDASERLRVTTDGGQTWSDPVPLPSTFDFGDLLDASTVYAAQATDTAGQLAITVGRTVDGGRTWVSVPVGALAWADGEESNVNVHFSDRQHGVVLAASWIYGPVPFGEPAGPASPRECLEWTTADGGATWTAVGGAPCLRTATWWTPTLGMLMPGLGGGEGGDVGVTRDGGRTWTRGTLPGVAADDSVQPYVLVETGTGRLRFAMTTMPRNGTVEGDQPLVVVESGDGGATWQEAYRSTALNAVSLANVRPLGEDHWMATQQRDMADPPYQRSVLLETIDGGRSWTQVGTLETIIGTVRWLDRLHGMAQGVDMGDCSHPDNACGGSGTMFLTNDGGATWHRVPF